MCASVQTYAWIVQENRLEERSQFGVNPFVSASLRFVLANPAIFGSLWPFWLAFRLMYHCDRPCLPYGTTREIRDLRCRNARLSGVIETTGATVAQWILLRCEPQFSDTARRADFASREADPSAGQFDILNSTPAPVVPCVWVVP
jgi:hypothetical protein